MDQAEILDYAVKTLVIILELSMLPIVVATVIGVFAFSESMTVIRMIGILLVLFSILLFSRKGNP